VYCRFKKRIYICQTKQRKNMKTQLAIVNRGQKFGMLFGVITKNEEIHAIIFKAIKENRAKKIVDTDTTLAYKIN
jgi:hypothetical protein